MLLRTLDISAESPLMIGPGGFHYNREIPVNRPDVTTALKRRFGQSGQRYRVLDLAGATGHWAEEVAQSGADVMIADFGDEALIRERIKRRNQHLHLAHDAIQFTSADVCFLDFGFIEAFNPDAITAFNLFQYLESQRVEALIKTVAPPLRKGSQIIVEFPGLPEDTPLNEIVPDTQGRIMRSSQQVAQESHPQPATFHHHPREMRLLVCRQGFGVDREETYPAKPDSWNYHMRFIKLTEAIAG